VVDQENTRSTKPRDMGDIGQGLSAIQHMDYRCNNRTRGLEQAMKSAAIHDGLLAGTNLRLGLTIFEIDCYNGSIIFVNASAGRKC
jgi:hypothetical protein